MILTPLTRSLTHSLTHSLTGQLLALLSAALSARARAPPPAAAEVKKEKDGGEEGVPAAALSDKDVEACFCVLAAVVGRLGPERQVDAVGRMAAAAVGMMAAGDQPQQTAAGIKVLVSVFNSCPHPTGKVAVLTTMVEHANGGGAAGAEAVAALITSAGMKESMAGWAAGVGADGGVSLGDWRRLLGACSDCLCRTQVAAAGRTRDVANIRAMFLATFEGVKDAGALAQSVTVAVQSLISILKHPDILLPSSAPSSPSTSSSDVLRSGAVAHLATRTSPTKVVTPAGEVSVKPSVLLSVVGTMAGGNYQDFKGAIAAGEGAALASALGLETDAALDGMRLIALAYLPRNLPKAGAGGGDEEVAYGAIAEALDVEDVEAWIVRAIRSGLLEAKLDQMRGVVRITNYTHSSLETEDWGLLQARLRSWMEGVAAAGAPAAPAADAPFAASAPQGIGAV